MTIGEKIKETRNKVGMSQQELADKLEIKCAGISQWETDKRTPRLDTLRKIANALGVDITELLELPPENKEQVLKLEKALSNAEKKLETAKMEGASQDEIADLQETLVAAEQALEGSIIPAKLNHQAELANRRMNEMFSVQTHDNHRPQPSNCEQEFISLLQQQTSSEHHAILPKQQEMWEQMRQLAYKIIHSTDYEKNASELLAAYEKLNDEGRMELIRRAEEMTYFPAYRNNIDAD